MGGWVPSSQNLARMSAGQKRRDPPTLETRDKISKSLTGRINGPLSQEHKDAVSAGKVGRKVPKLSASKKGAVWSPAQRAASERRRQEGKTRKDKGGTHPAQKIAHARRRQAGLTRKDKNTPHTSDAQLASYERSKSMTGIRRTPAQLCADKRRREDPPTPAQLAYWARMRGDPKVNKYKNDDQVDTINQADMR
jgi:hypothetical protein